VNYKILLVLCCAWLINGCAQLPQSSLTLSNSIAEDLPSMQAAHNSFVDFYFNELEATANEFIDTKYRPGLIQSVIKQDLAFFKDASRRDESLFNAIQQAFVDGEHLTQIQLAEAQANALLGMQFFYTDIDTQVALKRQSLLTPLRQQRQELLSLLSNNYANILKKNATITALLSSVVEVHETQQELLGMAGVDINVREVVGTKLTTLSAQLKDFRGLVDDKNTSVEDLEKNIERFKLNLKNLQ
jgi:hypothetical protein